MNKIWWESKKNSRTARDELIKTALQIGHNHSNLEGGREGGREEEKKREHTLEKEPVHMKTPKMKSKGKLTTTEPRAANSLIFQSF